MGFYDCVRPFLPSKRLKSKRQNPPPPPPPLLRLPLELYIEVLSYLTLGEQIRAGQVCSLWRNIIHNDEHLKRERYPTHDVLLKSGRRPTKLHRLISEPGRLGCVLKGGKVLTFGYLYDDTVGDLSRDASAKARRIDVSHHPFLDEPILYDSNSDVGELEGDGVVYNLRVECPLWTRLTRCDAGLMWSFEEKVPTVRELVLGIVDITNDRGMVDFYRLEEFLGKPRGGYFLQFRGPVEGRIHVLVDFCCLDSFEDTNNVVKR
ncbi:hypothetical protein TWF694_011545 [Orbilia ellipsospora]|uniref:F-box domain-containing protein n=1 Tax=Orbilia ellipsospora TaxID=2528407 RepID=A0AAV9X5J4_9PEZI